jgi:predicted transcriptional regulator
MEVVMTAKQRIMDLFRTTDGTLTHRQIATTLGLPEASVRREVRGLELAGSIMFDTLHEGTPHQFGMPEVVRARETAFP